MQGLSERPVATETMFPRQAHRLYIRWWQWSLAALRSRGVLAIVLGYLVLAVSYGVIIPLWEADNEWAHYRYARYIVTHHALPDPTERKPSERPPLFARRKWPAREWHQFSQPPLYYLLAAAVISPVDISDNLWPVPNPYVHSSTGVGGVNFAVHGPEESFPYRGTVLAVHLIRLLSAVLGLVALAGVYRLAQTIAPGRPELAWGTLALTAFSPQFLFAASTVNNDVLVTAAGAWTLVYGLRVVQSPRRLRNWGGAALWLSLAILAKYNGLVLAPFVALCFLIGFVRLAREREVRYLARALLGSGIVVFLLTGGWLISNRVRYGRFITRYPNLVDRFVSDLSSLGGTDLSWLTRERLWQAAVYSFETYWASFGWGNLGLPKLVYQVLAVFCLMAVAGIALRLSRSLFARRIERTVWISLLLLGLVMVAWLVGAYKALRTGEGRLHGRYLLPVLPAISFLLVWGIGAWSSGRRLRFTMAVLGGAFLLFAGWTAAGPLRAAYAPPAFSTQVTLAPDERPLGARFGENAELIAYTIWPETVSPGEAVGVRLLWRVLKPLDRNYTVGVHVVDARGVKVGETNIYPGRGNYATTLWRPGDVFRETYWVVVREPITRPIMGHIKVALFMDDDTREHLPVTDAHGNPLGGGVFFGRIKLAPSEPPTEPLPETGLARLDDIAWLSEGDWQAEIMPVTAGETFTVTLTWRALSRPATDYQVFVHLEGPDGPVAFGDGPPAGGTYPTGLWDRGERIVDEHVVRVPPDLPAGTYALAVGLYDAEGRRPATYGPDGERLPADRVVLDRIRVIRRDQKAFIPLVTHQEEVKGRKKR
ncbi:MAG: hypothetical protein GXP39_09125 [Chloroflexi bacterium]|nr:hypothetical protein [Chloroflexota bacterium]